MADQEEALCPVRSLPPPTPHPLFPCKSSTSALVSSTVPRGLKRTRNRDGGGRGQGSGVEELLAAFDEVGKEHERMEADKFNDDGTYKAGINKVRAV